MKTPMPASPASGAPRPGGGGRLKVPVGEQVAASVVESSPGKPSQAASEASKPLDLVEPVLGPPRPRRGAEGVLQALRTYLTAANATKGEDLASLYPDLFQDWREGVRGSDEPEPSEEDYAAFYEFVSSRADVLHELRSDHENIAPSYLFMDSLGRLNNACLVHFTSDPVAVERDGFLRGVADMERLGLTRTGDPHGNLVDLAQDVARDGFNFAYLPKDLWDYEQKRGGQRYAPGVVVFKASGLVVWHHTDRERQVIFMGCTAKDRRAILRDGDGWAMEGQRFPTLQAAVKAATTRTP